MTVLRALDGKFYDVPDADAAKYEVSRENVKELLAKSGPPAAGPGPGQGRPGGQHMTVPGGQVTIQVFPAPGGAPSRPAEGGEVDPYWWWWNNYWGNY